MVLPLKSWITFILRRPQPLPRFSTATRTSAARCPLSCRLPRRPACSPPIHVSSTSTSPYSGSRARLTIARRSRSHNRTDRVAAAQARQKPHACRWSSDRRPRTSGSAGSWSCAEPSRQSARLGDGSLHTATVVDSPGRTLADLRIGGRRSPRASGRPQDTLRRLPRWQSCFEIGAGSWETTVWALHHTTCGVLLSQPDKQKQSSPVSAEILRRNTAPSSATVSRSCLTPGGALRDYTQTTARSSSQ